MKKLKVLYWAPDENLTRVVSSIPETDRFVQVIAIPRSRFQKNLTIKKTMIYPRIHKKLPRFIKRFEPDLFIQCDDVDTSISDYIIKRGFKFGYINHGIWPKSKNNINRVKQPLWSNMDLVCGGTNNFKEIFDTHSNASPLIKLNALPQFDLLYNKLKKQKINKKDIIYNSKNPKAKALITLFGHRCKNRYSLLPHNAGYYKTAVKLEQLARKNNWLVAIKPKGSDVDRFLKGCREPWATKQLKKQYFELKSSKYIKFIPTKVLAYDYFCSDVIISSARSTIEVEAAMANKPFIKVWLPVKNVDDECLSFELGVLDFDASYLLKDLGELEDMVFSCLNDDNSDLFNNQQKLVKSLGINFDGKAYTRVWEGIEEVLSK